MIIGCRNLIKKYLTAGKTTIAVNNVSLEVKRGEFVVVLGHSGSGKTTLLSLIGGLTAPDSGEVYIDEVENWQQDDVALTTMRNKKIGFIFQFASLIPTLTTLENIKLPLSFAKGPMKAQRDAFEILEQVGLADKANAFPAQLSGGQQRRIAIARAFINNPDIILADEPTGDLDLQTEHDILNVFKSYNKQGTTFMVVTHNRDLAKSQDNARIMTMSQGMLQENAA